MTGEEMQRVELTSEDHRGGLLTQASILSLYFRWDQASSGASWKMDSRIHHRQGPAAAPGKCATDQGQCGQSTQGIAAREIGICIGRIANCAACHRKIDPPWPGIRQLRCHWATGAPKKSSVMVPAQTPRSMPVANCRMVGPSPMQPD